jgi:hypothetical protein
MPKDQKWLEMRDLRARDLNRDAWIPLRAYRKIASGVAYRVGYTEEIFGSGCVAFPVEVTEQVEKDFGWHAIGLAHDHEPYVQGGVYYAADAFVDRGLNGIRPVLSQRGSRIEGTVWHLHPDLFLGLRLKREGDLWLAMDEGYAEVVRESRGSDGEVCLIEIRASHLKDFLAARGMALYVSSYWSREFIDSSRIAVDWGSEFVQESAKKTRWEGRIDEINEDGHRIGEGVHIMHVGRTNYDVDQDVPEISPSDEFRTTSSQGIFLGTKVYRLWGELWRDQWVLPGGISTRIRGDKAPASVFFFTDAAGTKEAGQSLERGGRWLWFKPEVMNACLAFRGSSLEWYTADTGRITLGTGAGLHFGVNPLGLVNIYAKDIGFSSEWEQQVWAGFNVLPDGGVSRELLAAQAEGTPARTQAPEGFLSHGLDALNSASVRAFGFSVLKPHRETDRLIRVSHRFRATDRAGLYALAKDLARLTADSLDAARIQTKIKPPDGQRWGSLKSLENLLALAVSAEEAKAIMSPLFAVYDLRLSDAHLPSSEVDGALKLVGVDDTSQPTVLQGKRVLASVVDCIHTIAGHFDRLSNSNDSSGAANT